MGLALAVVLPQADLRAHAQEVDDLGARLEGAIDRAVAEMRISGLAAVIDVGGQPLLARGWGERAGRAVDAHTPFPAGSLTAQFIASGVMGLVDGGAVRLEARASEYLVELADDPRPITVEHLLAHASGLPPLAECPALRANAAAGEAALLAWIREAPSYADPGHCLVYSDSDTFLLGLILERVGGVPVRGWIEQRAIGDLELADTRYGPAAEVRDAYAGGQEVAGRFESDGDAPPRFDAHALRSSVHDLARLQRAWLDGRLVSNAAWQRMTSGGHFADGSPTHQGFGFALTSLGAHECVRFGGRACGARLLVAWYAGLDLTIALLAEGEDVPLETLERRLARLVFELPDPELQDVPLPADQLAPYLGDYYVGCTRHSIREGPDGRLRAWMPEAGERVLLAQGRHVFVASEDTDVRYQFEVRGGRAVAFVLDEHGTQSRAVRLD